jgi:hypothetical protein
MLETLPGNALRPIWIHSLEPCGPNPSPPTPTQPATWPLTTSGEAMGEMTAEIPWLRVAAVIPA